MFETPFSVSPKRTLNGHDIELRELMELVQGGPEVGKLFVNGKPVAAGERIGGPIIASGAYIYAPVFQKTFFKSGFKIARINSSNGDFKIISELFPLIHLLNIENGKLTFYIDKDASELKELGLEP